MNFFKKNSIIYDNELKRNVKLKKKKYVRLSLLFIISMFVYNYYIIKVNFFQKKYFKYLTFSNEKYNYAIFKKVTIFKKKKTKKSYV